MTESLEQAMHGGIEYLSCAETAKCIRKALKAAFPRTKFSVRSHTYSMGASIDVGWTDGPTEAEVRRVTNGFEGSNFDGMIDMKTHHDSWLEADGTAHVAHGSGTEGSRGVIPATMGSRRTADAKLVSFGADFVFTNRNYSAAFMARREDASREVKIGGSMRCEVCMMHFETVGYLVNVRYQTGGRHQDVACSRKCAARRSCQYVRGVIV